ncbi:MAG: hypothetical protein A2X12_00565 [Bacteroidetes bacterium GWE2_29_8]|nr:MAG: hypothetical protein A2X12_00565 [Bacteroidetes bacterium GWE2_29_8]OFY17713.1 MAG: hypothetical protein A2X02_03655 [Bacteroidetes bacterium GWF2_29_10]
MFNYFIVNAQINENVQSWTNRGSYGSYTQTISAGTVNMTRCIVASGASATGTCSVGRIQMEASNGVVELPTVSSCGIAEFHLAAGAAGRTIVLQSWNGSSWSTLTTFTGIGTIGATYTYSINSTSTQKLRLASPSAALYVHDIIIPYFSCPTSPVVTNISPSMGTVATLLTISGSNFTGTTAVKIGTTNITSYSIVNDNTITAIIPNGATTDNIIIEQGICVGSGGTFTIIEQSGCTSVSNISENIQSWTNRGSYGNYTQTISSGTVNMTQCIVANGASATGTCSSGRIQMQASNGIVELPTVSSCGIAEFHLAAGAAGRTVVLQSWNGSSWSTLTTFTGIGTTGATYTYTINSASSQKLRLSSPSAALYVHDIIIPSYGSAAPIITFNPSNRLNVVAGSSTTFSVTATGTITNYQWKCWNGSSWTNVINGGIYSGATTNTLTLTGLSVAYNNYQYYCEVKNGTCLTPSNAAILNVIAGVPSPATNLLFQNITGNSIDLKWNISADATGYVIKIRKTNNTFSDIAEGATLPSGSSSPWTDDEVIFTNSDRNGLTISGLDDNTTYYFKVYSYKLSGGIYYFNNTNGTNRAQSVTNSRVVTPPAFCEGLNTTISLIITNVNNAKYTWKVYNNSTGNWDALTNNSIYSGVNTAVLNINNTPATYNGNRYYCEITNTMHSCIAISNDVVITINPLPEKPQITYVQNNCGNTILQRATPISNVTFYWQSTNAMGTSTSNNGQYDTITSDGTYYLRARSDSACWSAESAFESVLIKVVPAVTFISSTSGCGEGIITVNSSINDFQTFELKDNAGNSLSPIRSVSITTNSYQFEGCADGIYKAVVTYNGCKSPVSSSTILSNNPIVEMPTIVDKTICGTGTINMDAIIGYNGNSIEWSLNGISIAETDNIPGPYEYTTPSITAGNNINIYARTVNTVTLCKSDWVISIASALTTSLAPSSVSVNHNNYCPNSIDTLTISYSGGVLGYEAAARWYSDSSCSNMISQGMGPQVINAPQTTSSYYLRFENNCNVTNPITLTINVKTNVAFSGITSSETIPVCENVLVNLNADNIIGTNAILNWRTEPNGNGQLLSNSSFLNNRHADSTYYARLTGDCGLPIEQSININSIQLPVILNNPVNRTICEGEATSFRCIASPVTSYKWESFDGLVWSEINNVAPYSQASTAILKLTSPDISLSGTYYRCVPINNGCSVASDTVLLTIKPVPHMNNVFGNDSACKNSVEVYYTNMVYTANYQWNINGGNIISGGTINDTAVTVIWDDNISNASIETFISVNGCNSNTTNTSIKIFGIAGESGKWTGMKDSLWNNCLNWDDAIIPDSNTTVNISNTNGFYPVINQSSYTNQAYCYDITIAENKKLSVINNGKLNVYRKLINNGILNNTSGTIELSGTALGKEIKGNNTSISIDSLIINSANNVNINNTDLVINNLVLEKGKVIIVDNNITINSTITQSNEQNYIVTNHDNTYTEKGFLIKNVESNIEEFPVGTISSYTPCYIGNNTVLGGNIFKVRVYDGVYYNRNSGGLIANIDHWINKTWEITPIGTPNVSINLKWNATEHGFAFNDLTAKMMSNSGPPSGTWEEVANSPSGATYCGNGVYSLLTNNVTHFSGKGIMDDNLQPLPVAITMFDAIKNNKVVDILWQTVTEINNDYFTIEKTTDLNYWEILKNVKGAGNSNSIKNYKITDDNPSAGYNYYRLKQIDFDGKQSITNPIKIYFEQQIFDENKIKINWAKEYNKLNIINLSPESNYTILIYDMTGRQIISQTKYSNSQGFIDFNLNNLEIVKGVYNIIIIGNNGITVNVKVLIE